MTSLTCINCGKVFHGDKEKFCSQSCKDSHIADLANKIREAVEADHSHTKKLSRDN